MPGSAGMGISLGSPVSHKAANEITVAGPADLISRQIPDAQDMGDSGPGAATAFRQREAGRARTR